MRKRILRTIGLATIAAGVTVAAPADFFPLENGNTWTYRDATTGQSLEIRVGTPLMTNDRVYYPVKGFAPKQLYVRSNEYGNLVFLDEDRQQELILTSFEVSPLIAAFEAYGRQCPATGRTLKERTEYLGPAGHWSTQEVQFTPYACADAGELSEQYVENVGMVRRVTQTFAGPRTFDLVFARVGQQTIVARDTGTFSVTAVPSAQTLGWEVTLRLDISRGISVQFPSSQEYDLRLRDSEGRVVWTWSADKLFLAALHSVNLSRWKATVEVPQPPAIPEGQQSYVLEAWLTTAQGEPQFAGATTVATTVPARTAATDGSRRR